MKVRNGSGCRFAWINNDNEGPVLLGLIEVGQQVGWHSAILVPASTIQPVLGISDSRNVNPRSIPNTLLPAEAAADMQNRPL